MDQLAGLKQAFARLGIAKIGALGAIAAATLLLLAWVATSSTEQKGLLYSGLDLSEAARIAHRLDEMKIPFEAKGDGSTIMVPASQIARVRMDLAAAGLPRQGGAGYELLDQQSPMNMTSFMQRVQRLRALEGELARTIVTINGVRTARVHIVLPDRETFARTAPKPTASVAVTMSGSGRLTIAQAAAIRLVVAGAVPGLQQESVSVLDPSGIVLGSDSPEGMTAGRMSEMKSNRETSLQRTVTDLLEPLVGRGKVRVAAAVDLDTSREVSHEEKFDPMSQVERSKQVQVDQETSDETKPRDPVSVSQNLPNQSQGQNNAQQGKTSASNSRSGQTINYEISSIRSERVREAGEVRRMTIAVVVDGLSDGKGGYETRGQEELTRFAELVQAAVGYDAKRGDRITVETMRFLPVEPLGSSAEAGAGEHTSMQWTWIAIGVLTALLVGGAVVVLQMRSRHQMALAFMNQNSQALPGQAGMVLNQITGVPGAAGVTVLTSAAGPAGALTVTTAEGQALALSVDQQIGADGEEVRAAGQAEADQPSLVALFDLIDSRPDEALAVLQSWLAGNQA